MPMPYVSPEQLMKDRADYARKGISRGRSVVAIAYAGGVLFVAENPSATLHKVSELYDRVAFAAVGRYSEFDQLRVQGIQLADVRGYQYAREDVTGRSLANVYANFLGRAFTEGAKPFEVELLVAEVADRESGTSRGQALEMYHILFDGSITDEADYVAIGGNADAIGGALGAAYSEGMDRDGALRAAQQALASAEEREIEPTTLEVAGLDRDRGRRKFFRLSPAEIAAALG